jgi:hypothetical protein
MNLQQSQELIWRREGSAQGHENEEAHREDSEALFRRKRELQNRVRDNPRVQSNVEEGELSCANG